CQDRDGDGFGLGVGCAHSGADVDDTDPRRCADTDGDGCDDCASGTFDPAADGTDTDGDGLCDLGDPDDDGDGVPDALDVAPLDRFRCGDADADGCDDCALSG